METTIHSDLVSPDTGTDTQKELLLSLIDFSIRVDIACPVIE